MQVTGTSPTTVRARVWPGHGRGARGLRLTTATDSTARPAGRRCGIALTSYLSSAATNAPLVARFTDLKAQPAP